MSAPVRYTAFAPKAGPRYTAFSVAGHVPRYTAFAPSAGPRYTAFIPADTSANPADITVTVGADCVAVQVLVARNWSALPNLRATVLLLGGDDSTLPANVGAVTTTTTAATVSFAAMTDGAYLVSVYDNSNARILTAVVPVVCRAGKCFDKLNTKLATAGPGGQVALDTHPDWEPWMQVCVRIRTALACIATADYATATALIASIAPYCTACADNCACSTCSSC